MRRRRIISTETALTAAAAANSGGTAPTTRQLLTLPWTFYHRITVPVGSQQKFEFFQVSGNNFTTNWKQAGQLSNEQTFNLKRVAFWFESGFRADGTIAAASAGAQAAASVAPIANAELLRLLHNIYRPEAWIGDRKIVEAPNCLWTPPCVGMVASTSLANTSATVAAMVNNGIPHRDNGWTFRGNGFQILPGQQVRFELNSGPLTNIPTITADSITVTCALEGSLSTPTR